MSIKRFVCAAAIALSLCGPSSAALLTATSGHAANTVTDYSGAGLVSFDLDLRNFSAVTLDFVIEEADLLGPFTINALVRDLAGAGIGQFTFSLTGISYAAAGSVTPAFGTLAGVGNSATVATIDFALPEYAEFQFGNPLGVAANTDWLLSTAGLRAGDRFSVTAAVPEPGSLSVVLSGLALVGLIALRRRRGI